MGFSMKGGGFVTRCAMKPYRHGRYSLQVNRLHLLLIISIMLSQQT